MANFGRTMTTIEKRCLVLVAVVGLCVLATCVYLFFHQTPTQTVSVEDVIPTTPVLAVKPTDKPAPQPDMAKGTSVYDVLAKAPAGELWIVADSDGYVANPAITVTDPEFAANMTDPKYVSLAVDGGGYYPAECVSVESQTNQQFRVFTCKKQNLDN